MNPQMLLQDVAPNQFKLVKKDIHEIHTWKFLLFGFEVIFVTVNFSI